MAETLIPTSRKARLSAVANRHADPTLIDAIVRVDSHPTVLRAAITNVATSAETLDWIYEWTTEPPLASLDNGWDFKLLWDGPGKESAAYVRYKIFGNLCRRKELPRALACRLVLDARGSGAIGNFMREGILSTQDILALIREKPSVASNIISFGDSAPSEVIDALLTLMVEGFDPAQGPNLSSQDAIWIDSMTHQPADETPRVRHARSAWIAHCLWELPDLTSEQRALIAGTWPEAVSPIRMTKFVKSPDGKAVATRIELDFPEYSGGTYTLGPNAADDEELIDREKRLFKDFDKFLSRWKEGHVEDPYFYAGSPRGDFEPSSLLQGPTTSRYLKAAAARSSHNWTHEQLAALAADPEPFVRYNIAWRRGLPADIAGILASDTVPAVRCAIAARQPGRDLTDTLLADQSAEVRDVAWLARDVHFKTFISGWGTSQESMVEVPRTGRAFGGSTGEWMEFASRQHTSAIPEVCIEVCQSPDTTTAGAREYLFAEFEAGDTSRLDDISDRTVLLLAGSSNADTRREVLQTLLGRSVTQSQLLGLADEEFDRPCVIGALVAASSDAQVRDAVLSSSDEWARAGVIYNWKWIGKQSEMEKNFPRSEALNRLGWELFDARAQRITLKKVVKMDQRRLRHGYSL